jgi:uncharacterized protein with HEPN domain
MARPTLADRLRHILDAIADVRDYTDGKSYEDYVADAMRRHAVERCLEIVSEIAWRGVADFGNVLRHDYPNVRDRRVWEIVTSDLAPLKAAAEAILYDLDTHGSG